MIYVLAHAFRWVISLIIIGVIIAFVVVNVIGYYEAPEPMPCPSSHCETYYDEDGTCWCECSTDGGLRVEISPCGEYNER